ncbi:MAG: PTS sugar transporter subunit IIB [Oscillospiraceae bacterium]|nr:PTS sugar transporter subunit IIB [Oscillospiraceae bacterium]
MKVLFICCAGMSTSLLVEKVIKVAKERNVELDLAAMGEAEARSQLKDADVILLGPQVRYLERSMGKELAGTDVKLGVVDMLAYGRMDGAKVLDQILQLAQG